MLSSAALETSTSTPQQAINRSMKSLGVICLGVRGQELVFQRTSSTPQDLSNPELAQKIITLLINDDLVKPALHDIKEISIV